MKLSVGVAGFLVVSAILLAFQCVNCAPNSEVSGKGDRTARYIQTVRDENQNVVKQANATSQVRQNNDYGNNRPNYNAGNNYDYAGNNYNNGGNNYNNGGNNYSNGGNTYSNGSNNYNNGGNNYNTVGNLNKPEFVPEEPVINETNDGNPDNNGVAMSPDRPPQQIGFAAVVSSFWNMVLSFIRGAMGIQRRDPPRIARALIRAAVSGKEECWKTSACHAGRMMRGLPNSDIVFMVAERFTTGEYKKLVRRVRRAAEDNENCSLYECND